MPRERVQLGAGQGVPKLGGAIRTSRCELLAIWAETHAGNCTLMPRERVQLGAGQGVPKLDFTGIDNVATPRGDAHAIWAETDTADRFCVTIAVELTLIELIAGQIPFKLPVLLRYGLKQIKSLADTIVVPSRLSQEVV